MSSCGAVHALVMFTDLRNVYVCVTRVLQDASDVLELLLDQDDSAVEVKLCSDLRLTSTILDCIQCPLGI